MVLRLLENVDGNLRTFGLGGGGGGLGIESRKR